MGWASWSIGWVYKSSGPRMSDSGHPGKQLEHPTGSGSNQTDNFEQPRVPTGVERRRNRPIHHACVQKRGGAEVSALSGSLIRIIGGRGDSKQMQTKLIKINLGKQGGWWTHYRTLLFLKTSIWA